MDELMRYKGIKLRIYPTKNQEYMIQRGFDNARWLWNQMLGLHIERYRNNKMSRSLYLSNYDLDYLLPRLKVEFPWLKDSESTSLQQINLQLHKAFLNFFKRRGGFPKFKSRRYSKQGYTSKNNNGVIKILDGHHIKLPKLKKVYYCGSIPEYSKIKSVTISKSPTGKYYASLLVEFENQEFNKTDGVVGIDMGVADLMITSDGEKIETIPFEKRLAKQKLVWERKRARRLAIAKKEIAYDLHYNPDNVRTLEDFSNYQKARVQVAKINEKIRNQRLDYLHKITTRLIKQYDTIIIEDLSIKDMMKNHNLARSIANQSWSTIRMMLQYKADWYGREVIIVPAYKTSQICSNCGYDDGKHELKIREWDCPSCKAHHDRDINAARNILNKAIN